MCLVDPHMHVGAVTLVIREQCQVTFSTALCFLETGFSLNLARLAGHWHPRVSFSLPTCAEVTGTQDHAQLYKNLSAGDLNSGPLVFTEDVLIHWANRHIDCWHAENWWWRILIASLGLIINLVTKFIFSVHLFSFKLFTYRFFCQQLVLSTIYFWTSCFFLSFCCRLGPAELLDMADSETWVLPCIL